ncbi:hypothetical protein ABW19_dt0202898 [Dactylella cylindrospora]|nr:hypothetical protein ABW19_dt0202898 [Dactylella cylindrospora]
MAGHIYDNIHRSRLTVYERSTSKVGELVPSQIEPEQHRILSIDMGIKNLALCLLQFNQKELASTRKPVVAEIIAWEKFSLLDSYPKAPTNTNTNDNHESRLQGNIDFSAASLAPLATLLARRFVANHEPTVIAIEKQRYRSMGSSAVLEWTLRVNSLEAMFHAALRVLQEDGIWKIGSTCSISPQQTTGFWLNHQGHPQGSTSGTASKALKVGLVKKWLENDKYLLYNKKKGNVLETVALFAKASGRSNLVAGEKLDDLADCLLQGLGILRWEENRLKLLRDLKIE